MCPLLHNSDRTIRIDRRYWLTYHGTKVSYKSIVQIPAEFSVCIFAQDNSIGKSEIVNTIIYLLSTVQYVLHYTQVLCSFSWITKMYFQALDCEINVNVKGLEWMQSMMLHHRYSNKE